MIHIQEKKQTIGFDSGSQVLNLEEKDFKAALLRSCLKIKQGMTTFYKRQNINKEKL